MQNKETNTTLQFTKYLFYTSVWIAGLYLVFSLRNVILVLFFVVILSYTLLPFVEFFEKYKIPRSITTASVLLLVLGLIGSVVVSIFNAVRREYSSFVEYLQNNSNRIDEYLSQIPFGETISSSIDDWLNSANINSGLSESITGVIEPLIGVGGVFLSGLFTILTAVTILFYLVYEPDKITSFLVNLFPNKYQQKVLHIERKIENTLSKWLQGQFILMIIMGIVSYIGFVFIGVPYPLLFGLMVGILDIIPVVGPLIALMPILVVTAFESPLKAVIVLLFFLFLQILEGNILVPKVMSKTVGLDPLYIIIALMVGSSLGGIIGGILAIPGSIITKILFEELRAKN